MMRKTLVFLAGFLSILLASGSAFGQTRRVVLKTLLEKEAEYCRRLDNVRLDLVCLEDITETIDQSKDVKTTDSVAPLNVAGMTEGSWTREGSMIPATRMKRTLLYDFQFVRKAGAIRESRILLKINGKETREDNAKLKTAFFVYKNALMGPVGIFAEQWQRRLDYKLGESVVLEGKPVVKIEVTPKAGLPGLPFLSGTAYVDENTLEILKIEWSEKGVGNLEIFEKRGEKYGLTPHISMVSEFNVEKNGIRFPTRHRIEEQYLDKKGKKFVRSVTSVAYGGFKFFTVEVETR